MATHVLSIDQGTTGTTVLVIDRRLRVQAKVNLEFPQHFPRPGQVEHDLEEIWGSTVKAVGRALARARVKGTAIAAIGITNQRETTALWDRARGRPVHRAIVWQDRRTADACAALRAAGEEERVRARTGLVLDPYFSATKIRWLLDHVKGARERAERGELAFGTVDTFLAWRLTGGAAHVTDASNASRTLLFDINTLTWDDDLLRLFGVPAAMLPEVLGSCALFGRTSAGIAGGEIAVTGVAGDQQAALFGQGCLAPGMAKATFGTGAFVVMNSGERAADGEGVLGTIAWRLPGEAVKYALEGSVFVAGAAVEWLKEGLGIIGSAAEV